MVTLLLKRYKLEEMWIDFTAHDPKTESYLSVLPKATIIDWEERFGHFVTVLRGNCVK